MSLRERHSCFAGLFIYLPEAFGQEFHVFLPDVLPVVLAGTLLVCVCCVHLCLYVRCAGLSDAIGPVRETALKAGQVRLVFGFCCAVTLYVVVLVVRGALRCLFVARCSILILCCSNW